MPPGGWGLLQALAYLFDVAFDGRFGPGEVVLELFQNQFFFPRQFADGPHLLQEMDEENDHLTTESLSKALSGCQKKLENLNQMRLRDLIGDDEYLEEKKRLLGEKTTIEKNVSGSGEVAQKVFEQAADTFIFAGSALERFNNGAIEDKRTVFKGLGSNFLLRDKKLTIQMEKPFVIIGNGLSSLKAKNDWLELSIRIPRAYRRAFKIFRRGVERRPLPCHGGCGAPADPAVRVLRYG